MASDDVCGHQNAHYLRMMSERDEARQQVADLRAGIEALLPGETVNVYAGGGNLVSQRRVVDPDHLRALLAGSGEQPGEDVTCSRCQTCGRDQRAGWCKHPAPAVPDVVRELDAVMHHHADRADAAEAEVERLREGIFAAVTVLNREFYRRPGTWVERLAADLRALLAGPGERPGGPVGTLRVSDWPDGKTAEVRLRSAPAVPDSTDVRDITDQVRYAWCWYGGATREESDQRAAQFDTWLASLAVVGQGVTAEPVAVVERVHEDQPVITARVYAPESWKHLGLGTHLYAAVRPSGQGGEDRG